MKGVLGIGTLFIIYSMSLVSLTKSTVLLGSALWRHAIRRPARSFGSSTAVLAEPLDKMTKQGVKPEDVKQVVAPGDKSAPILTDAEKLKAKKAKEERDKKERERLMRTSFTC